MKTSDFDYQLTESFIAQNPVTPRDHCKLMVFDTGLGEVKHMHFYDLKDFLSASDVLVLNRSKVIPARILFIIDGAEKEIFVLKKLKLNRWQVLVRPGRFFKQGMFFDIVPDHKVTVIEICDDGSRIVEANFDLLNFGVTPLPPYIKNSLAADSQYQTVYAKESGSVAAPTAGLHFTPGLLEELKTKGVDIEEVVLHVGRGTFLPVSVDLIADHVMHSEEFELPFVAAKKLNVAHNNGSRIFAVGTTSVRVLESSFDGSFVSGFSSTDIFITPGYKWKAVDGLITNFHLPKSTLLMLVASFLENKNVKSPVKKVLELYELAKANDYRFYSFGDAMLIL